jgi:hypothetical protein
MSGIRLSRHRILFYQSTKDSLSWQQRGSMGRCAVADAHVCVPSVVAAHALRHLGSILRRQHMVVWWSGGEATVWGFTVQEHA